MKRPQRIDADRGTRHVAQILQENSGSRVPTTMELLQQNTHYNRTLAVDCPLR